jgi:hypothetical protein
MFGRRYIKVDFSTAASRNIVWISQQMCHIMTSFLNCSMIVKEIKNLMFFKFFYNNIGFLMKGKIIRYPFCDSAVAKCTVS